MARGIPSLSSDQKEEVIRRVRENGERVPDLAKEFGVAPRSIYNALKKTAGGSSDALEIAKLKREKEALLKIIGELIANERTGKKI